MNAAIATLEELDLTLTERCILMLLQEKKPSVVSRRDIKSCYHPNRAQSDYETNVIDVHIKNLRRKLFSTNYTIETVRGVGYQLVSHPE